MALSTNFNISGMGAMISNDLVHILVCPACKGALEAVHGPQGLLCRSCGLKFPVRDGIPVMLVSEAEKTGE
jgi:uncharacterized protein YbaR (Trm112 family)